MSIAPRRVVADVAQEPPATRRPARAVVEREHEVRRPDAGAVRRRAPAARRREADGGRRRPDRGRSPRGRSPGRGGRPRERAPPRSPSAAARRRARRSQGAPGCDVQLEDLVVGEAGPEVGGTGSRRPRPRRSRSAPIPTASRRRSLPAASSRIAASVSDGRYGSWSQSLSAAEKSDASPLAAPAPSSAARPALAAASSWGTVAGSVLRELSVDVRSLGTTATAASGSRSAIRAIRPSHDEREPAEERRGEVVGVWLERDPDGEQLLGARVRRSCDEAERDRGRRRAEPTLERNPVREAEVLSGRVGEQRIRAHGEVGFVGGKLARHPRPRRSTPEPSVTSSSFQRSNATAAVSKPAPMLADVAGARKTVIPVRRRRSRRGRPRPARAPAHSGRRSPCP